jgi:hypothetical protein
MIAGRPVHHYAGFSDEQLSGEPFNLSDAEVKEVRTRLKDPKYDLTKRLAQVDRARRELAAEEEAPRPTALDPLPGEPRVTSGDMTRSVRDVLIDREAEGVQERRDEIEREAEERRREQAKIDEETARQQDKAFEENLERELEVQRKRAELRREEREQPRKIDEERRQARQSTSTVPDLEAREREAEMQQPVTKADIAAARQQREQPQRQTPPAQKPNDA